MKKFLYALVLLYIGAILMGVIKLDFDEKIISKANQPQIIVIGSAICALLLTFIFIRFEAIKEKLK